MIFLDNEKCKITDFKKIDLIEDNQIKILLKNQNLKIDGSKLRLVYFSKEEILITGKFESIKLYDQN